MKNKGLLIKVFVLFVAILPMVFFMNACRRDNGNRPTPEDIEITLTFVTSHWDGSEIVQSENSSTHTVPYGGGLAMFIPTPPPSFNTGNPRIVHEFVRWSPTPPALITADMTFTAQYDIVQSHQITFETLDPQTRRVEFVRDGHIPSFTGPATTIQYKSFVGWDLPIVAATEDRVYNALFAVNIPAETAVIANNAFMGLSNIVSINLPDSLTTIGANAFSGLTRLRELKIPASVGLIGVNAFADLLSLETINFYPANHENLLYTAEVFARAGQLSDGITVNFGAGVVRVPEHLFYATLHADRPNLSSVNFSEGSALTDIGRRAFATFNPSGFSIEIPATASTPTRDAFIGLNSIVMNNTNVFSHDGALYLRASNWLIIPPDGRVGSLTIPEGVVTIPTGILSNVAGVTEINLPATIRDLAAAPNLIHLFHHNLQRLNVAVGHPHYFSHSGILYTRANNAVAFVPRGIYGLIVIPEGVTAIRNFDLGASLFRIQLVLPTSLEIIYENAFGIGGARLMAVFFNGSPEAFADIDIEDGNLQLTLSPRLYYSEYLPLEPGHWWRWVRDDENILQPTPWLF